MLPSLATATERIGVSLEHESRIDGCTILQRDAHDLSCFESNRFDVVLCNAVLEHDPAFWLSLAEMRRVAKLGGLLVIGVPGYGIPQASLWRPFLALLARCFPPMSAARTRIEEHLIGTPVLGLHDFPKDFYRFSEQACRDVLLAGLQLLEVRRVLNPPRFIAAGRKPFNG
jgi:SAM-dependent methyltransferase